MSADHMADHTAAPAPTDGEIRFHVDRRGRILIENFDDDCLALAQALVPDDPAIQALLAAREQSVATTAGEDR